MYDSLFTCYFNSDFNGLVMGTWKIMYINVEDDYIWILKEGCKKDMLNYYNSVYKENRDVYKLLSPQEYTERFVWDF